MLLQISIGLCIEVYSGFHCDSTALVLIKIGKITNYGVTCILHSLSLFDLHYLHYKYISATVQNAEIVLYTIGPVCLA